MTQKIVVGLDIGTTKICSIVGRLNEHNKLEVLGIGKRPSDGGVTRGVVTNINKTVDAIIHSVKQAEEISNVDIQNVHVGIAGSHIKSFQHSGMLIRQDVDSEITQSDLKKLEEDMYRTAVQPGDKILHVLPQDYTVDGEPNISDPIGMAGIRLEGNFHIITGQISAVKNINRCVQRSDYQIAGITLEPLASASAVLSPEELEAGVALVDIGGGTTDVAIFHENIIRHSAVIPYGGDIITKDIKEGCSVMQSHAELLKVKAGSCLAELTNENEIITIPGIRGRDPKEISVKNLARIIEARMSEILNLVYYHIKASNMEKKLTCGIVLTGGGAMMKNIIQLCELTTGLDTRMGYPNEHLANSFSDDLKSPIYATAVGLVLRGYQDNLHFDNNHKTIEKAEVEQETIPQEEEKKNDGKKKQPKSNFFNTIGINLKEWLKDETDIQDFDDINK